MRPFVRALVGLLLALSLAACQRPAPPPNVVVVLLDTLRADHLGSYGNGEGLTPFLDQLAGRGVRFERAYATSSWTMPSVASLFTSRYPSQHGVSTMQSRLGEGETTLAEALVGRGYGAAGFSANLLVGAPHGFGQGFDPWTAFAVEPPAAKVRGATLRADSQRWHDIRPAGGPPLLLYYQFMEPHAPYEPPEPYRGRHVLPHAPGAIEAAAQVMEQHKIWNRPAEQIALLASLYRGEVAAADEEVRLLFADLERRGLLDRAVVVITADHGEEFGERGALSHGFTLYEEQLRVPLIVVAPDVAPAVVREPVSLIDVAPTVLDLAGVPVPPAFEGRSLVPHMRGAAAPPPVPVDLIAELEPMGARKGMRRHQNALVRGDHKLLRSPNPFVAPQLFDLATDPGERQPNPPAIADQLQTMLDDLSQLQARLAERASPASAPVVLDEATREKLRALGYE